MKKTAIIIEDLKQEMNQDNGYRLSFAVLDALYPKYISDEIMLSCICEFDENSSFYYKSFLGKLFSENINKNNALLFFKWIKNNKKKSFITSRYGDGYSEEAQEIFKVISNYLDKNIIDEVISLQLQTKHLYEFFSKDILQKIVENEHLRLYFINQLIAKSENKEIYDSLIYINSNDMIKIKDIPKLMLKYQKEKNEHRKKIIQNFVGSMFREYLSNGIYSDVDLIYKILKKYSELNDVFGYFINPIQIDPITILPIEEFHTNEKKWYYDRLKREHREEERKKEVIYRNDIQARISELLVEYEKNNNNINIFYPIWEYLNLKEDSSQYYLDLQLNINNEHSRWPDISYDTQEKIIELSIKFLMGFEDKNILNVSEYVIKNQTNSSWNALAFLPIIKEKISQAAYQELIKKWNEVIIYFPSYHEVDLPLRKSLIFDLYNLDQEMVFTIMLKIIEKTKNSLHHNFLKGFDLIWDEHFNDKLYQFIKNNKASISFECQKDILSKLAKQGHEETKKFLKNEIVFISQNVNDDNIGKLIAVLNIFIYHYSDSWAFVKKSIYKSSYNKQIISSIVSRIDCFGNSNHYLFEILSDNDLIMLYSWLVDNFKEVHEPDPVGPHSVNQIKEFTKSLINHFIETGNIETFKKIKKAYLRNRENKKDYEIYFKRNLHRAKYIKLELTPINKKALGILESKYYKETKGWFIMNIGKYIFNNNGDNTINEDNKKVEISPSLRIALVIILIIVLLILVLLILVLTGKISLNDFNMLLKNLVESFTKLL